jgi:hypothetical protein
MCFTLRPPYDFILLDYTFKCEKQLAHFSSRISHLVVAVYAAQMINMFGYGEMKGWQAVPIIIPLFLFTSIGTIWYFSFHHFKERRPEASGSTVNSSSRDSRSSEMTMPDPRNSDHLVHMIDIPPLPQAYTQLRRYAGPVSIYEY